MSNTQKKHESTQHLLETMQENRRAVEEAKAELLEQNNVLKLHEENGTPAPEQTGTSEGATQSLANSLQMDAVKSDSTSFAPSRTTASLEQMPYMAGFSELLKLQTEVMQSTWNFWSGVYAGSMQALYDSLPQHNASKKQAGA